MYPVILFFSFILVNISPSYAMSENSIETADEFLHPVTKFRFHKGSEPVLDYKDDQGFAPLKVSPQHVSSKYWNMEFETYHYQYKNLFNYELGGHKMYRGIHFPNITRYYQVAIHYNHKNIVVKLSDDSFKTIDILGTISLKKKGWDLHQGLQFCSDFLHRHILFDHLYFHFYGKNKVPTDKVDNKPYWTVIDDYILSQTMNVKDIPQSLDDSPNTEIIRQIGDFFKWRNIMIKFIDVLPRQFMSEFHISRMFKRYLIDEIHVSEDIADKHSKMMTLEKAQIVMLMATMKPDNMVHLNLIFDKLIEGEFIPAKMRKPYMEIFTG